MCDFVEQTLLCGETGESQSGFFLEENKQQMHYGYSNRAWDFFLIYPLFLYLYSHVVQPLQSLLILVQVVSLVVVPYLTFVIMKYYTAICIKKKKKNLF